MILILMGNGSPDLDTAKDSAAPVVIETAATCEVVEELKCHVGVKDRQVKPVAIKTEQQIYLQPWDEAIQALRKIEVQQKKFAETKTVD